MSLVPCRCVNVGLNDERRSPEINSTNVLYLVFKYDTCGLKVLSKF
jgi:hypothetical protein